MKRNIFIVSFILVFAIGLAYSQVNGMGKNTQSKAKDVCAVCHATSGVMSMFGFESFLGAQGHMELEDSYYVDAVKCKECHDGNMAENFMELVHKGHFIDPKGRMFLDGNNHYTLLYGAKCTHCHQLQPDGSMVIPGFN